MVRPDAETSFLKGRYPSDLMQVFILAEYVSIDPPTVE